MTATDSSAPRLRTGWATGLALCGLVSVVFLTATGLVITFAAFSATIQWTVLFHTGIGLITLIPLVWYSLAHWKDYRALPMSHVVLLGWVAAVALLVVSVSGLVVTVQALFGVATSWAWRQVHLISTFVLVATFLPHLVIPLVRMVRQAQAARAWRALGLTTAGTVVCALIIAGVAMLYPGAEYVNEFPEDYSYIYGEDTPFRPSLARTRAQGAASSPPRRPRGGAGSSSTTSPSCAPPVSGCATRSIHSPSSRYAVAKAMRPRRWKIPTTPRTPCTPRWPARTAWPNCAGGARLRSPSAPGSGSIPARWSSAISARPAGSTTPSLAMR